MDAPAILYLAGLVFSEALRLPRRVARSQSSREWSRTSLANRLPESLVLGAVLIGIWALPIVYVFTDWLEPARLLPPCLVHLARSVCLPGQPGDPMEGAA